MEGYLILFTLPVALGNRYYLARLLLLVFFEMSQRWRNKVGVGVGAWGETQDKHLPTFQGMLPPRQHQLGWLRLQQQSFGSSITPTESRRTGTCSLQACALCPWCGDPLLGQSLRQGIALLIALTGCALCHA